jgi:hypothetical protein
MGTPSSTKTVRVSHETHAQLTALGDRLNGTVDDAVRWLFAREGMVRVPCSDRQRERWQRSATQAGLPLPEFLAAVTEAAVAYGTDRGTMVLMQDHLREIREILRANLPT